MKKILSLIVALALLPLSSFGAAAAGEQPPALIVNMTAENHDILHGSAGFLYGISNEGVPDVNTLTPLKPKVLATKGALGTEHPYGDALDVAEEFFEAGGEQVQMYTSNYYGVFGVTADANDYGRALREVIAPAVAEWKDGMREKYPDIDKRIVYIPINEHTPANINGGYNYNEAWKIYYEAIKASDPEAVIAGPNDEDYRAENDWRGSTRSFLAFCRDNNCLPDIATWHELQVSDLKDMNMHIADYRAVCAELGIEPRQVVINEYADFADCGVPGRLVNWIARLEDNQVYGCLPFWHQANNLNDLAADANQGNGAWQVYKWYGDMSGKTLDLTAENTTFDGFYGLASIDENKRTAAVLCGGVDGEASVTLENIADTSAFAGADRVNVKVEATYFTGYHGAAYEPETVMEGVFPVVDGSVKINLSDMLFSAAYRITVTETGSPVSSPTVGGFRATYEAEDANLLGDLIIDTQDTPLEQPRYFCSGGKRVGGIDAEGEGIEYFIDIPFDALYKLSFIYGNGVGSARNNAAAHRPLNITQRLVIDGEERPLLLPNTLFYSMEGMAEEYVSLSAGRHKVALMYGGEAGGFHDALYVTCAGAYGGERPAFNRLYQAEEADFNAFAGETLVRAETAVPLYSGSGYVTGLEKRSVEEGGGIRWIVDVEKSGFYHLSFRCSPEADGSLGVYLDNTNLTYSNKIADIEISASDEWADFHTTAFLRRGINIVDIDTDCPAAVDYMRVLWAGIDGASQTFEAEEADGSYHTAAAAGGEVYVTEMAGASEPEEYLELNVTAPEDGLYRMQVFQSNNDLCGTHTYNIKIIDRYASFEVNGDREGAKRYFFPNTFSDDTFMERTVPISLRAGENTIKIYNDDSWHVLWGGSTSEPGTNELKNFTPNFDRFIISPAVIDAEIGDMAYPISLSSTGGGYIYCDKNEARFGETVTVYLLPDGAVRRLAVNGEDVTELVSTADGSIYTAEITVTGDTDVFAEFTSAEEGGFEWPEIPADGTVAYNGRRYKIAGGNLFDNGDFSDNSSKEKMSEWYVGKHTGGHPDSGSDMPPRIKPDGSLENLLPLTESGRLIMNAFEPPHGNNVFYFGTDGSRPEGLKHYLVENIVSEPNPWESCAWNGEYSLLAFVPLKSNTKYYFRFNAYTQRGQASVRFGAIKMDSYIPDEYSEGGTLNFSGSGYMDCHNGGQQNVGGGWTTHETVIDSGDGDYFLFNAYWLQMAEFLCMGGFELYELEGGPLVRINEIKNPDAQTLMAGERLSLPEAVEAVDENGQSLSLPVEWLNADGVNTDAPGVYAVTGLVKTPEGYYYDGVSYVRLRVVVKAERPALITVAKLEPDSVTVELTAYEPVKGRLYAATGLKIAGESVKLTVGETAGFTFPLTGAAGSLKLMLWNDALEPLADAVVRDISPDSGEQ